MAAFARVKFRSTLRRFESGPTWSLPQMRVAGCRIVGKQLFRFQVFLSARPHAYKAQSAATAQECLGPERKQSPLDAFGEKSSAPPGPPLVAFVKGWLVQTVLATLLTSDISLQGFDVLASCSQNPEPCLAFRTTWRASLINSFKSSGRAGRCDLAQRRVFQFSLISCAIFLWPAIPPAKLRVRETLWMPSRCWGTCVVPCKAAAGVLSRLAQRLAAHGTFQASARACAA